MSLTDAPCRLTNRHKAKRTAVAPTRIMASSRLNLRDLKSAMNGWAPDDHGSQRVESLVIRPIRHGGFVRRRWSPAHSPNAVEHSSCSKPSEPDCRSRLRPAIRIGGRSPLLQKTGRFSTPSTSPASPGMLDGVAPSPRPSPRRQRFLGQVYLTLPEAKIQFKAVKPRNARVDFLGPQLGRQVLEVRLQLICIGGVIVCY